MKNSDFIRSLLLASALLGTSAHAADPQPAVPGAVDLRALMALLNKLVAESEDEPESAPAEPAAKAPAAAGQPLASAPKSSRLSTSSLTPSNGLGGRGPGATVRPTEENWRLLFPLKQPGH